MAEYTKDKRFSTGWVIGGSALMIVTNLFGGIVAGGVGVTSIWVLAGVAVGCFAVGGFVIGWKSEGQTILEAGIAAVVALAASFLIRNARLPDDPVVLGIGFGVPFVAAIIGAWIGEKVQGDVIRTKDD